MSGTEERRENRISAQQLGQMLKETIALGARVDSRETVRVTHRFLENLHYLKWKLKEQKGGAR